MSTLRRLHVSNAGQRNAVIVASSVSPPAPPAMGKAGQSARFQRFVAAGSGRLDLDLVGELGSDYATALIDGDPEIDRETVGRFIDGTQSVVWDEAENRLHVQKALMEWLLLGIRAS